MLEKVRLVLEFARCRTHARTIRHHVEKMDHDIHPDYVEILGRDVKSRTFFFEGGGGGKFYIPPKTTKCPLTDQ